MSSDRETFVRSTILDQSMRIGSVLVFVVGLCIVLSPIVFPSHRDISFRAALLAFEQQDSMALKRIEEHVAKFPNDFHAIFLAGEIAAKQFQHERAIEFYRMLPDDNGSWELFAELGLARRCRILGRMLEEEEHLNNVLRLDPTHSDANHRLGHLLQVEGRTWESAVPFMMQLRRGRCRGDELMGVATTERFFRADDDIAYATGKIADPDAIASLGDARKMLFENRNTEAEHLLRQIVAESPQIGEAQGRLGRIIVERGQREEFMVWRASLPDGARQHPEVWFVHGLQSRRAGLIDGAIFCFLQALKLSPNHLPANVQIAGCLELAGKTEAARVFQDRAEVLSELETILNLLRDRIDEELILKAVDRLVTLHRYWEAAGWLHVLAQLELPFNPSRPTAAKWSRLAISDSRQNLAFSELLESLELSAFMEPNWGSIAPELSSQRATEPSPQANALDLQLDDDALKVGVRFEYFEGTDYVNRLDHIFNVVGGGVAVIDIDHDGWPDLHVAQANDWRNTENQRVTTDVVFRNIRGEQFVEVAEIANVLEPSFSHGVSAEDFDQDGFTDVYVCNLGSNRLFKNNGDGTFNDVTESAGVGGEQWSISSVIADFSGDGLPDLYVGNYTKLDETAGKECHNSSGKAMACTPDVLTAESDRLYLNRGDGTFSDITTDSGIRETSGRALGLIGWDFTGNGRMSLFVANDTSANFLFHNTETSGSGVPRFLEEGVLRGLAFDGDGNAQASMGVAAADANNDGQIDLFVTNFSNESNTFYTQALDGAFYDSTRQMNLRDSSYSMLGFGTQFIDLDGDGWEDIVSVNGHVDQSEASPDADKMYAQVFRNEGGDSFSEVPKERLGPYFQQKYLGRAVATFDWNRDGRFDMAISHLHSPFSLVTNKTPWTAKSLSIRLVGRNGVKSATGAKVRARFAGRDWHRLALAGDGYLVTNENLLQFSVPANQQIESLEVQWPSGLTQQWIDLSSGCELALIEGRSNAVVLQRFREQQ